MDRNTILFYVTAVIGLVVMTFFSTQQAEISEIAALPAPTLDLSQPTLIPTETPPPPPCPPTVNTLQRRYLPSSEISTNTLTLQAWIPISPINLAGVVYASDCETPLPNTLVRLQVQDQETTTWLQMRTDEKGQYRFTLIGREDEIGQNPPRLGLFFQVSTPDKKPSFDQNLFGGDLHLTSEIFPSVATMSIQQEFANGAFDIVLPVDGVE